MNTLQKVFFGFFLGIIAAAAIYIIAAQPRGEPIKLLPPNTPAPITVYIVGAVKKPGVYTIDASSRVEALIKIAGGFNDQADQAAVNLAAPVLDGQKITVPDLSPTSAPGISKPAGQSKIGTSMVNINTAGKNELSSLPGIGDAKAQDIINYRESSGLFSKIEDIQKVSGIGPGIFEKIKGLITVN